MAEPRTWHHGLIAEWWARFNTEGPEIEHFARWLAEGQPGLDAGCGTGRLLLPWLRAGYDVDGCDVSADMLGLCRVRAERDGLEPTLWRTALHELDPPRRYRTVVCCGTFGLGSTRAQDQEALRRFRAALEPGGTLLLDNEAPYANERRWPEWTAAGRANLPEPWPDRDERDRSEDGAEYALRARALSRDPLDQSTTMEIEARKWSAEGALVATETHAITIRSYFRDELLLMLERAGFGDVAVYGDQTDEPPTPGSETLTFEARA